jgi:aryl-alcohol dehydrogenase
MLESRTNSLKGAGSVAAVGSKVSSVAVGDNVIISYTSCGDCRNCKSHKTSFCKDWEQDNFGVGRHDGSKAYSSTSGEPITSHFFGQSSMARHCVASERSVIKVPAEAPLEMLAPLGCGVMTGAGAMLNVVKPDAHSSVAVAGAGAVGLAAIMAAKLGPEPPKQLIAIDVVPSRLELAKKYGATHIINSAEVKDLRQALLDLTDGEGISGAIDCTGRPDVINSLIESTGKMGITVTVGVGRVSSHCSCFFH